MGEHRHQIDMRSRLERITDSVTFERAVAFCLGAGFTSLAYAVWLSLAYFFRSGS